MGCGIGALGRRRGAAVPSGRHHRPGRLGHRRRRLAGPGHRHPHLHPRHRRRGTGPGDSTTCGKKSATPRSATPTLGRFHDRRVARAGRQGRRVQRPHRDRRARRPAARGARRSRSSSTSGQVVGQRQIADLEAGVRRPAGGGSRGPRRVEAGPLRQRRPRRVASPRSKSIPRPATSASVKMVHVQDGGLPLNRLALESQINGGMIQSHGHGPVRGPRDGRASWASCSTPASATTSCPAAWKCPSWSRIIDDGDTRQAVIGIAEPANIPGVGAVANAVYNACGVRVRDLPDHPGQDPDGTGGESVNTGDGGGNPKPETRNQKPE